MTKEEYLDIREKAIKQTKEMVLGLWKQAIEEYYNDGRYGSAVSENYKIWFDLFTDPDKISTFSISNQDALELIQECASYNLEVRKNSPKEEGDLIFVRIHYKSERADVYGSARVDINHIFRSPYGEPLSNAKTIYEMVHLQTFIEELKKHGASYDDIGFVSFPEEVIEQYLQEQKRKEQNQLKRERQRIITEATSSLSKEDCSNIEKQLEKNTNLTFRKIMLGLVDSYRYSFEDGIITNHFYFVSLSTKFETCKNSELPPFAKLKAYSDKNGITDLICCSLRAKNVTLKQDQLLTMLSAQGVVFNFTNGTIDMTISEEDITNYAEKNNIDCTPIKFTPRKQQNHFNIVTIEDIENNTQDFFARIMQKASEEKKRNKFIQTLGFVDVPIKFCDPSEIKIDAKYKEEDKKFLNYLKDYNSKSNDEDRVIFASVSSTNFVLIKLSLLKELCKQYNVKALLNYQFLTVPVASLEMFENQMSARSKN